MEEEPGIEIHRDGVWVAAARIEPLGDEHARVEYLPDYVFGRRHISGLTQPEFARHRGISVQALRQIESGNANPTIATLNAIVEIFGLKTGFVPIPERLAP